MRQTPRLNRKRQETLTGDSDGTLASARLLDEDRVCPKTRRSLPQAEPASVTAEAGTMWVAALPAAAVACTSPRVCKARVFESAVRLAALTSTKLDNLGEEGLDATMSMQSCSDRKINTARRGKGVC